MSAFRLTAVLLLFTVLVSHVTGQELEATTYVETIKGRRSDIDLHRISLSGTARNFDNEPVANAIIIVGMADLNRISGTNQSGKKREFQFELTRVMTDESGDFRVADLLVPTFKPVGNNPDSVPARTPIQLIGIAEGYGLTWCQSFQFRAGKRRAKTFEDEEGKVFFSDEAIKTELVFPATIPLHGKVTDQNGNPIAGVTVRVGLVNRSDDGPDDQPRSTSFSFGKDTPLGDLGYPMMPLIPEDLRMTKTNAKGEYKFNSIPDGIGMSMSFSHPSFLSHHSKSVTTIPGVGRRVLIGPDGELDVSVDLGNTVALGATDPNSGELVPGVKFELIGARKIQQNSIATADESGIASMRIFPGNYQIRIVPPAGDKYWATSDVILVSDDQKVGEKLTWDLLPAQKMQLVARSGKAGVAFEFTRDENTWSPVPTQGSYTEYAKTNADGVLKAVLPPDAVAIRVATAEGATSQKIGEQTQLVFASQDGAETITVERTSTDANYSQKALRGIYRYRSNNSLEKDISQSEFRDAINEIAKLDAEQVKRQLTDFFGEIPTGELSLVQGVGRRRVDRKYTYGATVYHDYHLTDGENEIRFGSTNRQCNVYKAGQSRIHLPSVFGLLARPIPAGSEDVKRQGDRLVLEKAENGRSYRMEQDAESGFVHFREYLHAKGGESLWQLAPFQVRGLSFPKIVIEGNYRDGKLLRAKVTFIDEVQLLDSIPAETFAMSLSAGTNVFDERAIDRNQVSRRGRHTGIKTDCLDLIARIGEASQPRDTDQPVMRYGDDAPQLQIQSWIKNGRTIDVPDLSGKRLLLVFMPADESDFRSDLPALRRMIAAVDGNDDTRVVAIFSPPLRASDVAKLAVLRDLDCIVALDKPSGQRLHSGATRSSYPGYSQQITVVVDTEGKVKNVASYNDNIDSTTKWHTK